MDSFALPAPDGVVVEAVDADGVEGELLRLDGAHARGTLLVLHGGGYEIGSVASHRRMAGMTALACGMDALAVEYRLAPEHPCPAAVEDAAAAYRWLLRAEPRPLVITGDSAGGGLAVATMFALRDAGDPLPSGAVLLAPWLDLTLAGESVATRAEVDLMLDAEGLRQAAHGYAGSRPLDDPLVSPLFGDLRGLPPMLVQVGDHDLLVDDARRFADVGARAGVAVTLDVAPEMPHVFHNFAGVVPEADAAFERMRTWIDELLRS